MAQSSLKVLLELAKRSNVFLAILLASLDEKTAAKLLKKIRAS